MRIKSEELITDLIERTRKHLNRAEELNQMSLEELNWKSTPESWSILECTEHLNYYGDFYLPEISKRIGDSRNGNEEYFNSGLLGNYFAKSMLPKEKLNKIKTFKNMDPSGSKLDKSCIERFIEQQHTLLELLDKARKVSLNKTKTAISISKWIKLKLGDTFRVVIYHNERHMVQITKVMQLMIEK